MRYTGPAMSDEKRSLESYEAAEELRNTVDRLRAGGRGRQLGLLEVTT
jgi:hypothetical protein